MGLLSNEKYGRLLVESMLIAMFFGGAFVFVLIFSWPLLEASDDTLLAKIGTITSVGGVFLGTYIAVWLINQNRTKNIIENYFYKVSILTSTSEMLNGVILFIEETKSELRRHQIDEYRVEEYPEVVPKFFEYSKDLAEIINSNTLVPADIRTDIVSLLQHGANLIMIFSENQSVHSAVIPDVPDLAPDANRSMGARPDDPYVRPKRSPETRYDEQRQNI